MPKKITCRYGKNGYFGICGCDSCRAGERAIAAMIETKKKAPARLTWCINHAESLASIAHRFQSLPPQQYEAEILEAIDLEIRNSENEATIHAQPAPLSAN